MSVVPAYARQIQREPQSVAHAGRRWLVVVGGGLAGAQSGGDHSGDQSAGVIDLADQQIAELGDGEGFAFGQHAMALAQAGVRPRV